MIYLKKNKLKFILLILFTFFNYSIVNAQCNLLCNTDFENNQIAGTTVTIQDASFIPCWGTTAPDNMIEVWANGFNGVPSYSGNQFIELNAFYVSTLYQNFSVAPSTSITVSFAHRGRAGIDTMSVGIGPVGGPYTILGTYGDGNTAWGYYTVGYIIPSGLGSNYTLRFNSVYATGGNQAIGNFLDDISVNLPSSSVLSFVTNSVSCFSGNNGSAQVNVTGGSSPFTYSWNPTGAITSSISSITAGTYSVSVTESNGCKKTGTVSITQGNPLNFTVTPQNTTCFGANDGSVNANVTGGTAPYTYTWLPSGGNAASASGLSPATYTLQTISANGCTGTKTVAIASGNPLNFTVTPQNTTCFGINDGSVTANVTGGTAPYTYTWLPSGGNASSASGLSPTTYTLQTMSANGCTGTKTVVIAFGNPLNFTVTPQNTTCFGANDGSVTANVSGGTAPYTYTWLPSGGNAASASGLSPATYTLQTISANGCTGTKTVAIASGNPLNFTVTPQNTTCFGINDGSVTANVTGGTAPYTYTWLPSGGNASSASGLFPTTYTLQTMSANGCTGTKTVVINQGSTFTVSISSQNITCYGLNNGNANVNVNGGVSPYTYSWSPIGVNSQNISGLTSGTYSCQIIDQNNCIVTKTISIIEPPSFSISVNSATICSGNTIKLYAYGALSYTWSPGNKHGAIYSIKPLSTTNYTVIGANSNGCNAQAIASILVYPLPNVFAGRDTTTNIDVPITLSGIASNYYGWISLNGSQLNCNFCTSITENPQENTCYILQATNQFNCTNTDTVCVKVLNDWDIFIPNTFTPNKDGVNDIFIPVGYGIDEIEMFIFDRWGELIFNTTDKDKGWDGTLKNVLCKTDVYIYKLNIKPMGRNGTEERTGHINLIR